VWTGVDKKVVCFIEYIEFSLKAANLEPQLLLSGIHMILFIQESFNIFSPKFECK